MLGAHATRGRGSFLEPELELGAGIVGEGQNSSWVRGSSARVRVRVIAREGSMAGLGWDGWTDGWIKNLTQLLILCIVPRCEDEFTKVAIRFMRINKGRRNKDHGCVASHPTI